MTRRRSVIERVDPEFKDLMDKIHPGETFPTKTRLLNKVLEEILFGKGKIKKK